MTDLKKGAASIVIASFLWGAAAAPRKILFNTVSPYTVVMLTTMIATVTLFIINRKVLVTNMHGLNVRVLRNFFTLALLGSAIAPLLYNYGLSYIDVSKGVILERSQAIFTIILGSIVLKEVYSKAFYLYFIMMMMASVVLIVGGKNFSFVSMGDTDIIGAILIVLAGLSWAGSAVLAKKLLISTMPVVLLFYRLLFTCLILMPYFVISDKYYIELQNISYISILLILLIGIVAIALAFLMFYHGLKLIPAGYSGALELMVPVSGVAGGFFILDERLTHWQYLAGIAIILGSYLITKLPSNKRGDR